MMILENILSYWEQSLYLHPLVICFALFAFIRLLQFKKDQKVKKLFLAYTGSLIVLFVFGDIVAAFYNKKDDGSHLLTEIVNLFFSVLEVSVFCSFLLSYISSKTAKRVFKLLLDAFYIVSVLVLLHICNKQLAWQGVTKALEIYSVLEFCILLIFTLYFYFECFLKNKLFSVPEYFIVTSLLCYTVISIPIFAIAINIWQTNAHIYYLLIGLHYIFLSLLCFSLAYYTFRRHQKQVATQIAI